MATPTEQNPSSTATIQEPESKPHQSDSLEQAIRHRHSIRFYLPSPVPRPLLTHALSLAQLAPSNSNIQNWRLHLASGPARSRIVSALSTAASTAGPSGIPPLPREYQHFRSEFGHLLYGEEGYGIGREEKDRHAAAMMRNFRFFDAPVVGVISMDRALRAVDAMSVGGFVQTFMLALTEVGLGSCLLVSVTGYEGVLREGFGVEEGQEVLCGISVGWPSEENRVNDLVVPRSSVDECVTFLEE